MTNSSLDLSARADLAWLADLIGDAQRAVPSVEWLIVGALARDLHLSYAHGIRQGVKERRTACVGSRRTHSNRPLRSQQLMALPAFIKVCTRQSAFPLPSSLRTPDR